MAGLGYLQVGEPVGGDNDMFALPEMNATTTSLETGAGWLPGC